MGLCGKCDVKNLINFRINVEPKPEVQAHTHFQCCSSFLHAQRVVASLAQDKNE